MVGERDISKIEDGGLLLRQHALHTRSPWFISCVLSLHTAIAPASAQETPTVSELTEAEATEFAELLERAKRSYEAANYPDAIVSLERAWTILPEPKIKRRLGQLYELTEQPTRALQAYSEYLVLHPNAPDSARVRSAIAALEEGTRGSLIVDSTPRGATVFMKRRQELALGTTPLSLTVEPGTYTVLLEHKGREPREQNVELRAGQEVRILIELPETSLTASTGGNKRTARFTLAGLAIATGAGATVSRVIARRMRREISNVNEHRAGEFRPADYDNRVQQYNRIHILSLSSTAISLASASASIVLWRRDLDAAAVAVGFSGKTVNWSVRF